MGKPLFLVFGVIGVRRRVHKEYKVQRSPLLVTIVIVYMDIRDPVPLEEHSKIFKLQKCSN